MTSCHSIERAKERIGINARTAEHVMRNALERGKDKTEFGWRQQSWLTAKETACGCRALIYNDYCFIVNQDDLIVTLYKFDDTFMSAVFDGQINETELLLRVVLGREDIQVKSCEAQFYISNIYGREARLDILARDQSGKAYNVEVQRVLSGASVQRARFNSAMVDVMLLKKGEAHFFLC